MMDRSEPRRGEDSLGERDDHERDPRADAAADPDVLTVEEGAALLRIGRNTLYHAIGRGQIPHRKIGKVIRLSRAALVRWLDSWSTQDAKEGH